ncbi:MAG: prephenate dehydrogenase [Flavobacteriales bacterium]|jgi:prephenate dehydrogenase|nr:prephenate dehydrogenase [Flavobacteriales bacterium]|tara:strand:- start:9939 stop:10790 length:852 start_codon:yes stop_codon:yes gene_type:complete
MKIGIAGIGLIGGSLAIQLRKTIKDVIIYGYDSSEINLKKGIDLELIDAEILKKDFAELDVIFLTFPVKEITNQLSSILDLVSKKTLVIDFGSTKSKICESISSHPKRSQFLATHPIAGTEFSGPTAAKNNLFNGKVQIICESHKTDENHLEWALNWFSSIGMILKEMNPEDHDKHIAYVSHLSHISSFILGQTVLEKEKDESAIFAMAGSGFASTVRLAKSSPQTWSSIFEENKENVLETLKHYLTNLESFKSLLENDEYKKIYHTIEKTNAIKSVLKGIKK